MKYRNLKINFEIDDVRFTVLSIGSECFLGPIPRHSHSRNSYEMHFIASGYGTLIADEIKYDIVPGDFYMTGPGINHEQISNPINPMTEYGIYLQIDMDHKIRKSSPVSLFMKNKFWMGNIGSKYISLFDSILEELNDRPYGYEQMLPPLLKQLTLSVIREYSFLSGVHTQPEISQNSPEDLIYLTIEEAFLYNYKNLSLEKLASEINLGTRQTERLLRKHYSKSFSQMKTEARMSAARLLLTETDNTISSIAEQLGYSSSEHFTNAFKNYYHLSPGKYRKA